MLPRTLLFSLVFACSTTIEKSPSDPGDDAAPQTSSSDLDGDDTGIPCPDEDSDGVCDSDDICTGGDDNIDADGDGNPDHCDPCPEDNPDDSDRDGVCDSDDVCEGADDNLDTDGDGVANGCDPCPEDPLDDSDGDTICDSDDICDGGDDGVDIDADGAPDHCDPCPEDNTDDSDGDGVCNSDDACEGADDIFDTDGDDVPDACDPCPEDAPDDTDRDGVCDSDDICDHHDDSLDADGDLVPDGCDPCPLDSTDDSDGDTICDSEDACPGHDDAVDTDADGVADGCDLCEGGSDLADADGDSIPDACDDCPFDATGDTDADTVCDSDDICPGGDDRIDSDADGTPDDCDDCPTDATDDSDGDTVCDSDDICADGDDRIDTDLDGIPDDCDACSGGDDATDSDGDGVADFCDPCPVDNPDDSDGDGICDSDPVPMPNGLIVAWTGSLAEVPSGWAVCDGSDGTPDLRDRFVLGLGAGAPGETGGSDAHDHGAESDETSLTTGTASPGGRSCSYPGCWCTMKAYTASHSHDFTHGHTMAEDTMLPPYYEVIYLMNTGADALPSSAVLAWSRTDDALSDDWEVCDGLGVCPDLRDRFLKGAPDGADAGETGGAETHDHMAYTGEVESTSGYSGGGRVVSSGGDSATDSNHSHGYLHDHWVTADSHVPPYIALSWVSPFDTTASTSGVIAMWSGEVDELPEGWVLCDGTDDTPDLTSYFVRGAPADSEIGTEGGTESHDHVLASDPGGTTDSSTGGNGSCTSGSELMDFHSHSVPSHSHSMASDNNAPPHMMLAYIMYQP